MACRIGAAYDAFRKGAVIPASPLALTKERKWDERRQRGLWRYYAASGAGGIAIGVHTTQFAIRDVGLYQPLLAFASETFTQLDTMHERTFFRIAGICGKTSKAVAEATLARDTGFHAGLLSLAAMQGANLDDLEAHCRAVGEIIPLIGFYLQPAVGGGLLPFAFWWRFVEIPSVLAIKVAPFNRYQTIDVMRAVAESGRDDIVLYTGNDDAIVSDLITPYVFEGKTLRFAGGLLGHWSVWTQRAVALHEACRAAAESGVVPTTLLQHAIEVTDSNAAFFDAANGFAGCIAGLHEVLRRQGLLEGLWCLDPNERLSPGQADEIDRVYRAYPHLNDDAFVAEHRDAWLDM